MISSKYEKQFPPSVTIPPSIPCYVTSRESASTLEAPVTNDWKLSLSVTYFWQFKLSVTNDWQSSLSDTNVWQISLSDTNDWQSRLSVTATVWRLLAARVSPLLQSCHVLAFILEVDGWSTSCSYSISTRGRFLFDFSFFPFPLLTSWSSELLSLLLSLSASLSSPCSLSMSLNKGNNHALYVT